MSEPLRLSKKVLVLSGTPDDFQLEPIQSLDCGDCRTEGNSQGIIVQLNSPNMITIANVCKRIYIPNVVGNNKC